MIIKNESEERIDLDKIIGIISYINKIDLCKSKFNGFKKEENLKQKLGEHYTIETIYKYLVKNYTIPIFVID